MLNQGEEIAWKWAYKGQIPENAVPCDDTQLGGTSNCFLGQSLYGDGICQESIGKIDPVEDKIHMTKKGRLIFLIFLKITHVTIMKHSEIQVDLKRVTHTG